MSASSPPTKLAPHHLRLFALIVDYLVITTILKLADQIALGQHWDLAPQAEGVPGLSAAWVAGLILLMMAKDAVRGRSLGKWVTGLAVADAHDPAVPASLSRTLLRNVTLLILPVEVVLVFTDRHCRRLGDRLAGTVVVVPAQIASYIRRLGLIAILFLGFLLASFLLAPWNMKRSSAYQEAYRIASTHPALTGAVGSPATLDPSPTFELALEGEGGTATLTIEAEGPRGKGEAEVMLRMASGPRRWELALMTIVKKSEKPSTR